MKRGGRNPSGEVGPRPDLATLPSEIGCIHQAYGTFHRGCENCMRRLGAKLKEKETHG